MKPSDGYMVRFYEAGACIRTQVVFRCKAARETARAFGGIRQIIQRGHVRDLIQYATYSKV